MSDIGIVSYGASIPRMRIKIEDIAVVWGKDGKSISKGLGICEKSVPSADQDTATISVSYLSPLTRSDSMSWALTS